MTLPLRLAAGLAIETEPVRGEACQFRTAWPLVLWPIEIEAVRLAGLPLAAPANPLAHGAVAVLRIVLKCRSPEATFAALGVDRLRFFLRGPANVTLALYELLCAHTLSVAYADGPSDPAPVIVPADGDRAGRFRAPTKRCCRGRRAAFPGFGCSANISLLQRNSCSSILQELRRRACLSGGNRLEIFVYLDRASPELERTVNADLFALGCVPIVNLFKQQCEPIRLTHTDTEYRIVPDARRAPNFEVWQVERVHETRSDGSVAAVATVLSPDPGRPRGRCPAALLIRSCGATDRRAAARFISRPTIRSSIPRRPGGSVISVEALCTNRDLPAALPFGGGHPELRLVEPLGRRRPSLLRIRADPAVASAAA